MQVARIISKDSEGEVLLLGMITLASGGTVIERVVREFSYTSQLNSGGTSFELTVQTSKVTRKFKDRTIKLGDTSKEQYIEVYVGADGMNTPIADQVLDIQATVTSYLDNKPLGKITCTSDAINISQNRNEFEYKTNAEGKTEILPIISDIIINSGMKPAEYDEQGQVIEPEKGFLLELNNVSTFSGYIGASSSDPAIPLSPQSVVFRSHGQYPNELLSHLLFLTAGYDTETANAEGVVEKTYQQPVVYFPDRTNRRKVNLSTFSLGADGTKKSIEISHNNKLIISTVEKNKPDKETVINRAYFYRAIPAQYNPDGTLLKEGNPNKMYTTKWEPDTIQTYGSRAVSISYPEYMDKSTEGERTLLQIGTGICRLQNEPQTLVICTCDYEKLIDKSRTILNEVFHVIDDRGSGDLGEYVCIKFELNYPKMECILTLAEKNPYTNEDMADITNLQEQRISALESKTMNLTNELVMAIGSASLQRVTIDCDKYWNERAITGLTNIATIQVTPRLATSSGAIDSYLGSSNARWSYIYGKNLNISGGTASLPATTASSLTVSGTTTTASLVPSNNNSYSIGNSSNRYSGVYAYVGNFSSTLTLNGYSVATQSWCNNNFADYSHSHSYLPTSGYSYMSGTYRPSTNGNTYFGTTSYRIGGSYFKAIYVTGSQNAGYLNEGSTSMSEGNLFATRDWVRDNSGGDIKYYGKNSSSNSGYIEFSNGYMIQWGYGYFQTSSSGRTGTYTSFGTSQYSVVVVWQGDHNQIPFVGVPNVDSNGFRAIGKVVQGAMANISNPPWVYRGDRFLWIAFGY